MLERPCSTLGFLVTESPDRYWLGGPLLRLGWRCLCRGRETISIGGMLDGTCEALPLCWCSL